MSPNPTLAAQIEDAGQDLEAILVEVLELVFTEEADPVDASAFAEAADAEEEIAFSRLEIHDTDHDTFAVVEVLLRRSAALDLAARMLETSEPARDDLLDAVGELGNIAAGNVKGLLGLTSRLSLPSAELLGGDPDAGAGGVRVAAIVAGHVVQLAVFAADTSNAVLWPGGVPA